MASRNLSILILLIIVLSASPILAIGGDRSGFTLGGGLGYAPVAEFAIGSDDAVVKSGITYTWFSGFGISNTDAITFQSNTVLWTDGRRFDLNAGTINWYHFFGETSGSYYFRAGTGGMGVWEQDKGPENEQYIPDGNSKTGFAVVFGGGYELRKRLLIDFVAIFGRGDDIDLAQLSFQVVFMGY